MSWSECQTSAAVLERNGVVAGVPELDSHEVEDVTAAADEEHLHGKVVQRNPGP